MDTIDINDSLFNSFFFDVNNSRDPRLSLNVDAIAPPVALCDDTNLFSFHESENLIAHTMLDGVNKENLLDPDFSSKKLQRNCSVKRPLEKSEGQNSGNLKKLNK